MPDIPTLKDKAAAYDRLVEHWFFDVFHGSVVARSTEVWNVVFDAKEELKRRLADNLAKSTDD